MQSYVAVRFVLGTWRFTLELVENLLTEQVSFEIQKVLWELLNVRVIFWMGRGRAKLFILTKLHQFASSDFYITQCLRLGRFRRLSFLIQVRMNQTILKKHFDAIEMKYFDGPESFYYYYFYFTFCFVGNSETFVLRSQLEEFFFLNI